MCVRMCVSVFACACVCARARACEEGKGREKDKSSPKIKDGRLLMSTLRFAQLL